MKEPFLTHYESEMCTIENNFYFIIEMCFCPVDDVENFILYFQRKSSIGKRIVKLNRLWKSCLQDEHSFDVSFIPQNKSFKVHLKNHWTRCRVTCKNMSNTQQKIPSDLKQEPVLMHWEKQSNAKGIMINQLCEDPFNLVHHKNTMLPDL